MNHNNNILNKILQIKSEENKKIQILSRFYKNIKVIFEKNKSHST